MSHSHRPNTVCSAKSKKACDEKHANWQADQQVILALKVVAQGRSASYKKDDTVFGQLVRVLAGEKPGITNGEGNEASAPFTKRLLASVERYNAGALSRQAALYRRTIEGETR